MKSSNNILNKPFKFSDYAEFVSYCNQNNLIIEDKGDFFEATEYQITLENLKNSKLDLLKYNVENFFYINYPIYKQNNIAIFGSEEEKSNFKNFHDKVVNKYNNIAYSINNSRNKEELNNIDINFKI